MWLLRSQLPENINTVEKLYLWCFYLLSSSTEKVKIEGEYEYLVDGELIRPDGVDPRLFFVTKINLPIDENWLLNGFKLWENAQEILQGLIISPIPVDPYLANVILHLKGDDFTDTTGNSIVENWANSFIDDTLSKYGGRSIRLNGGLIRINNNLLLFNAGDFTIEGWLFHAGQNGTRIGFWCSGTNQTGNPLAYNYWQSYSCELGAVYDNYRSYNLTFGSFTGNYNKWVHFALVRKDGIKKLWINGEQSGGSYSYTRDYNPKCLFLGCIGNTYLSQYRFIGNIDSFRVSNVARYDQPFDPETDTYLAY